MGVWRTLPTSACKLLVAYRLPLALCRLAHYFLTSSGMHRRVDSVLDAPARALSACSRFLNDYKSADNANTDRGKAATRPLRLDLCGHELAKDGSCKLSALVPDRMLTSLTKCHGGFIQHNNVKQYLCRAFDEEYWRWAATVGAD